ncbi:hypothetical protein TTE1004 [Caldanaerobacter subterraneus subsp. tengcongensis MB4]|uniref:Uncharacterized protein n=1 Tax=Caldanaerobacter subterraneus subsp. tengcongensis (strain DSM 15242 / JCM 11007 / NBRC 100824 / MB4) TaxID=273068 RepID=Q8RB21_CALS4|nr:hypothetical protein TTE1004 [Caldanaerobacter subterraneus subsp. tengcongensis MB4]
MRRIFEVKIKKVLKWAFATLALELAFLYYLNNVFLVDSTFIKSEEVFGSISLPPLIEIKIPSYAKDVHVSYDGKYISYDEGGNLIIADAKTGKTVKVIEKATKEGDYYTWLPDRNRILYFSRMDSLTGTKVELKSYDVDNDLYNTVYIKIYLPSKSAISYVTLSPLTNVIYLKATTPYGDRLYQVNIMGEVRRIYLPVKRIEKMVETQRKDNLIYQSDDGRLYLLKDGRKQVLLSAKNKYALLGIDRDDNVYIGKMGTEGIEEIYYDSVDKPIGMWHKISLKRGQVLKDLVVLFNEKSVGIITGNNRLEDLRGNVISEAKGKIIEITRDYIVYKNGDKIILKRFSRD